MAGASTTLLDSQPAGDNSAFARWTAGRNVASFGTNDGIPPLAFQNWHKFKEAFTPEFVAYAISESSGRVDSCFDPFGGSGTTALTCQMLGIDSVTTEVNPFLADVIRAKTTSYNIDRVTTALAEVRRRALRFPQSGEEYFHGLPQTFTPPGRGGRWVFDLPVLDALASVLAAIDKIPDIDVRRLFRSLIGGILVDVSNTTVNGKGRRYRRGKGFGLRDGSEVHTKFAAQADFALRDIIHYADRPRPSTIVTTADARTFDPGREIDLSVFSPPYPNSFDYTDVYNIELWMLGYLNNSAANQTLRRETLSSHVQLLRDYPPPPEGSKSLESALGRLRHEQSRLWSPWIPSMLGAYFTDLMKVLNPLRSRLTPGGSVWLVVGDSRYADVTVPVARILGELAEAHGWCVTRTQPIRHMRSSAQQGGRAELPESLVVLRPASTQS